MPDFHNSDVGLSQIKCRMSDFHNSGVGFPKSDVGWHLQASVVSSHLHVHCSNLHEQMSGDRSFSQLFARSNSSIYDIREVSISFIMFRPAISH